MNFLNPLAPNTAGGFNQWKIHCNVNFKHEEPLAMQGANNPSEIVTTSHGVDDEGHTGSFKFKV